MRRMRADRRPRRKVEALLSVLAQISDSDALYELFCDLLTVREIEDAAGRLEVARLLDAGASYVEIQKKTGASATTVSRVSKCLNYGTGGYRRALDVLAAHETVGR